jgi:hypothetical protein
MYASWAAGEDANMTEMEGRRGVVHVFPQHNTDGEIGGAALGEER